MRAELHLDLARVLIQFHAGRIAVFFLFRFSCVQVIPVNANGVPIGEIPFVRSGLLGFVGPVSRIVLLKQSICSSLSSPVKHPDPSVFEWF